MGDLTANFSEHEFSCPCGCVSPRPNLLLVNKLQLLRDFIGPLKINSGYRCKEYNIQVKGNPNSQHLLYKAVDPSTKGWSGAKRFLLVSKAIELGFTGIGIYENFIHLDIRDGQAVLFRGKY